MWTQVLTVARVAHRYLDVNPGSHGCKPNAFTRKNRKSEWPTTSAFKPYLSQFGCSHHRRARNNGNAWVSEAIINWNLNLPVSSAVEFDYEHNPHARFLMTVLQEIEPRYGTNYAVSLASVTWLRGSPSGSQIVIAIVWLRTQIAHHKITIVWQAFKNNF